MLQCHELLTDVANLAILQAPPSLSSTYLLLSILFILNWANVVLKFKFLGRGGTFMGERKLIPRILLASMEGEGEGELLFILSRRKQFPTRLCFAII